MTYEETLAYLYASTPAFHLVGAEAYKPGLDNSRALLAHVGNPHLRFRSIHVAGTNGKGSTSHLIAACLQAAGLKVGLYTSPHLVDYRERIRINGEMIPRENVVRFVEENHIFLEQLRPSFFETTMAMAFQYFADRHVDVAVVEVGLGGRLDSTNVLLPILSVITNIGMDHEEFLGNTLAAIAWEKAGIIKPNTPCVIGESNPETDPVFEAKARECGIWGDGLETTSCRIWFADQCYYLNRLRKRQIPQCQLLGSYQEHNQQTAFAALMVLMQLQVFPLTIAHIIQGYARVCAMTGLRGRWEVLSQSPLTICDTGHNSHGLKYVAQQLRELMNNRLTTNDHVSTDNFPTSNLPTNNLPTNNLPATGLPATGLPATGLPTTDNRMTTDAPSPILHIIFGMVDDKDYEQVLSLMPAQHTRYYFCQAHTHRAVPAATLLSLWQQIHPQTLSDGTLCSNKVVSDESYGSHDTVSDESYGSHDTVSDESYDSPLAALKAAQAAAKDTDILFIGGSNYVVGEVLNLFKFLTPNPS